MLMITRLPWNNARYTGVIPDDKAAELKLLRIVDESGEDYLYPAAYFAPVELSTEAQQALRLAG